MTSNAEEFYKKLKSQLEDTATFPTAYMYKFIVPTSGPQTNEVMTFFDNMGATINTKQSKNGKYTSITIEVLMPSADAIISKYKEVSNIEGIISL